MTGAGPAYGACVPHAASSASRSLIPTRPSPSRSAAHGDGHAPQDARRISRSVIPTTRRRSPIGAIQSRVGKLGTGALGGLVYGVTLGAVLAEAWPERVLGLILLLHTGGAVAGTGALVWLL